MDDAPNGQAPTNPGEADSSGKPELNQTAQALMGWGGGVRLFKLWGCRPNTRRIRRGRSHRPPHTRGPIQPIHDPHPDRRQPPRGVRRHTYHHIPASVCPPMDGERL